MCRFLARRFWKMLSAPAGPRLSRRPGIYWLIRGGAMPTEIKMPQLGESITEGTVSRWLKEVGEPVEQYEILFEVETDKVNSEIPAPVRGTLLKILVPEGQTVPVGTVLALVGAE